MNCKQCAKPYEAKAKGRKPAYCSRQCQNKAWRQSNKELVAKQVSRRLELLRQNTHKKLNSLEAKQCVICQSSIEPLKIVYGSEVCSRPCQIKRDSQKRTTEQIRANKERQKKANPDRFKDLAQDNRAMRKSRFRAQVKRAEIYARDGYVCQLCNLPVVMTAQIPKHKKSECCETQCFLAPTIDHITPLANGGWHQPENVQTAHFICNSKKSNSETLHLTEIGR
jgi:5-methylcytosine-specific restriction endonuclease McrA